MAALFFILLPQAHANVLINEFMAINGAYPIGLSGDFDDWIELYNDSNEPVDVGGFYLTDDLSNPTQWRFPTDSARETTLGPQGFLLIMADNDLTTGQWHHVALTSADSAVLSFTQMDSYLDGQITDPHGFELTAVGTANDASGPIRFMGFTAAADAPPGVGPFAGKITYA